MNTYIGFIDSPPTTLKSEKIVKKFTEYSESKLVHLTVLNYRQGIVKVIMYIY